MNKEFMLNEEQGKIFISALDDDLHKKIAKRIFVDGMTNEEVAEEISYSTRQIERIRISLMKTVLKRLIEKPMPKKVTHEATLYRCCTCPTCKNVVDEFTDFLDKRVRVTVQHCKFCGQALDWSDTE